MEIRNAVTFTGVIREKDKNQATEEILTPKSRKSIDSWMEKHQEHIRKLKKKEVKCILLGDSIIKHVTKSSVAKRIEWEAAKIANFGIKRR